MEVLTARLGGTGPIEDLTAGGYHYWGREKKGSVKTVERSPTYVLLHGLALTPAIFQGWFWQTKDCRTIAPLLDPSDVADPQRPMDSHAKTLSRILEGLQSEKRGDVVIVGFSVGADILLTKSFAPPDCVKGVVLLDPNVSARDCFFSTVLAEAGMKDPKGRLPARRLLLKMLGELGDDLDSPGDFEAKMWYFSEVLQQLRTPFISSGLSMDELTLRLAKYAKAVIREAKVPFPERIARLITKVGKDTRITLVASKDGKGYAGIKGRLPSRVIQIPEKKRGHFDLIGYKALLDYISGKVAQT